MATMVPGEEAAAATKRRRPSDVWGSFRNYNCQATCVECGRTLCAGKKNGTSHLRRHTKTARCQKRAAELRRRHQLITAPNSAAPGDDDHESPPSPPIAAEDEEDKDADNLFTVDGIYIPELHDKLIAMGMDSIDNQSSFAAANSNHVVPAVPQAASASTRWFINKTKERKKAETKKRCSPDDDECGRSMSSTHSHTST